MNNVVPIIQSMDVPATLRRIADDIESGELPSDNCTVITAGNLFQVGSVNDVQAAMDCLWNLAWGKSFLMSRALGLEEADDE